MRLASLIISISKIHDNRVEVGQKGPRKWVEIFTFDAIRTEEQGKGIQRKGRYHQNSGLRDIH